MRVCIVQCVCTSAGSHRVSVCEDRGACVTVSHRGCAHTACAGVRAHPAPWVCGAVAPLPGAHRAAGAGPFGGYSRRACLAGLPGG